MYVSDNAPRRIKTSRFSLTLLKCIFKWKTWRCTYFTKTERITETLSFRFSWVVLSRFKIDSCTKVIKIWFSADCMQSIFKPTLVKNIIVVYFRYTHKSPCCRVKSRWQIYVWQCSNSLQYTKQLYTALTQCFWRVLNMQTSKLNAEVTQDKSCSNSVPP